jgi:hypothetical protein
MNNFIKHTLFFSLFSVAVFLLMAFVYVKVKSVDLNYIPPPRIANNISFNDKMVFANNKMVDHLAIGSSMSLCNLHSETITNMLHTDSYLNLGSWGLNISDSYVLLREYSKIRIPKTIFMSSNLVDFCPKQVIFDTDEVHNILTSSYISYYYIKYPEFRYYLSIANHYKKIKSTHNIYESLVYDEYGAVCYGDKMDDFNETKWFDTQVANELDQSNYAWLDSLAGFAQRHNIRFVFFQSPFREGIIEHIDQTQLNNHTKKVASILKKYKHTFINTTDRNWADTLYVDGTHLTWKGAKVFTNYCLGKLKTQENTENSLYGSRLDRIN